MFILKKVVFITNFFCLYSPAPFYVDSSDDLLRLQLSDRLSAAKVMILSMSWKIILHPEMNKLPLLTKQSIWLHNAT